MKVLVTGAAGSIGRALVRGLPDLGHEIRPDTHYGVAKASARACWDLDPGRALGYDPQDDAEAYADDVTARPGDKAENAYAGGPHVSQLQLPAAF